MKYYTKKWYGMMQYWGLGDQFEELPEREYTDEDIEALYNAMLQDEIDEDEEFFNTPPDYGLWEDILANPEEIDLEDMIIVDEENDTYHVPESLDEVIENMKAEYARDLEAFENRGAFDPSETIENFETAYQSGLRNAAGFYPAWMSEAVDPRLIALGYLTSEAHKKYCAEIAEIEAEWNRINESFEAFNEEQNIPSEIIEKFDLHDGELIALEEEGPDLVMTIDRCGMWSDEEESEVKLRFCNARVLEKEDNVRPGASFLYFELHRREGSGYEVHMMFFGEDELGYLTIGCEAIE